MKKYQSFGFLASIVFAVGMVGFNLSDGTIGTNQGDVSPMGSSAGFVGHVEAIHKNPDGEIIGYIQTDNAIANSGINCTMAKMFEVAYSISGAGCSADPGTFDHIGLSNATMASMGLNANVTTNFYVTGNANGLGPVEDTTVTFNSLATGAGAAESDRTTNAEVLVSSLFTSQGDSHAIFGATLQNGTANEGIFAYKDFGSSVTLNDGDTLTVNWQIGMSGTFDPTT